jgi:hypothetical protein
MDPAFERAVQGAVADLAGAYERFQAGAARIDASMASLDIDVTGLECSLHGLETQTSRVKECHGMAQVSAVRRGQTHAEVSRDIAAALSPA